MLTPLADIFSTWVVSDHQQLLAMALLLTFLISAKRWFIDYFLLGIDGPRSTGERFSLRVMTHFSYLQGVATATLSIFWFGTSVISVKLGILDALICMLFYMTRDAMQLLTERLRSLWVLRRIFITEVLRFAGLVFLISVMFFESHVSSIEKLVSTATTNFNSLFDAKMTVDEVLRSVMFSVSTFFAFSFACNILQHLGWVQAGKFSWQNLFTIFMICFLLYFTTTTHSTFNAVAVSACVASTYYYSRVIACRLQQVLSPVGARISQACFFTGLTLLGLANALFYHSLFR